MMNGSWDMGYGILAGWLFVRSSARSRILSDTATATATATTVPREVK